MTTTATPTRMRLTVRGRRVFTALAAAPIVAAIAFAAMNGGAATASKEQPAPAGSFETITVMPGDSLWAIAQDIAPHEDPRDVVAAISDLNQLGSMPLQTGERLAIPAEYSAS